MDVFLRFFAVDAPVFLVLRVPFSFRFFFIPVFVFVELDRPTVLFRVPPRPRLRLLLLPRPRPRLRPRPVLPRPRVDATVRAVRVVATRQNITLLEYTIYINAVLATGDPLGCLLHVPLIFAGPQLNFLAH